MEKLLTVEDLANKLQVSTMWIYQKVKEGKIPCIRLDRTIRFDPEEIDKFLSSKKS